MSGERHRAPVSRRTLLAGGVGAVAALATGVALGAPAVSAMLEGPPGKLLTPLLAAKGFTVAHRGGSADWPEMSGYAYAQSVSARADALEVSLSRTSDGVWFGLHDTTLDRTSGTQGFLAAEHTWAEVKAHRISAAETHDPHQPPRPYLALDALLASYTATHTIFVDPKWVPASFYPELLGILTSASRHPAETFVAKYYGMGTGWARAAREAGLQTWGYYYGKDINADPSGLDSTAENWDLLGLDHGASRSAWTTVKSFGRPVLGHVIADKADADEALRKGAAGLVVSGVTEVLG